MKIVIEYLKKFCEEPLTVFLSPKEYFDPIDKGETYEKDAIPRYNLAGDYLDLEKSELTWTKLSILGTNEDKVIFTHYLGDGETWMSHRKDTDGFEEIIHSVQEDKQTCHIIRTHKDSYGNWNINYNGIIYDLDDGSQKKVRFDNVGE